MVQQVFLISTFYSGNPLQIWLLHSSSMLYVVLVSRQNYKVIQCHGPEVQQILSYSQISWEELKREKTLKLTFFYVESTNLVCNYCQVLVLVVTQFYTMSVPCRGTVTFLYVSYPNLFTFPVSVKSCCSSVGSSLVHFYIALKTVREYPHGK